MQFKTTKMLETRALGMAMGTILSSKHTEDEFGQVMQALADNNYDTLENLAVLVWDVYEEMSNPEVAEFIQNTAQEFLEHLLWAATPDDTPVAAVIMQGGLCQNVVSSIPMHYIVVDHDTEGADKDEVYTFKSADGSVQEVVGSRYEAECDPDEVDRIASGLDARQVGIAA